MNWQHFMKSMKQTDVDYCLTVPTSNTILQSIKSHFSIKELPIELEALYKQTNGISQVLNQEPIGELIWSAEQVIEENKIYRNSAALKDLYMSFEQLLFFADAGNGDLFAFIVLEQSFPRKDIFVWNHENDSRTWIAPDLKTFVDGWLKGRLGI